MNSGDSHLGYSAPVSEDQHIQNISNLAASISRNCSPLLSEGGFRFGIAQKALSVYLKYLPAKGGDVIAFDPGLKRIYVACYDGAISVFQEDDPTHFRKLGDVPVQKKVHSLAIDLETHRVFVPEQEENGAPAATIVVYDAVPSS